MGQPTPYGMYHRTGGDPPTEQFSLRNDEETQPWHLIGGRFEPETTYARPKPEPEPEPEEEEEDNTPQVVEVMKVQLSPLQKVTYIIVIITCCVVLYAMWRGYLGLLSFQHGLQQWLNSFNTDLGAVGG